MLSCKCCMAAAIVLKDAVSSNGELIALLRDALSCRTVEADVFTYEGRTLVIARHAPPLQSRFSPMLRIRRANKN